MTIHDSCNAANLREIHDLLDCINDDMTINADFHCVNVSEGNTLGATLLDVLSELERRRVELARLKAHKGDPCIYCKTPHDAVQSGDCPGTRDSLVAEINTMVLKSLMHRHVGPDRACAACGHDLTHESHVRA